MLAWRSPGQPPRPLCASRNSWSLPGFTRNRTTLKAVMAAPCRWSSGGDARLVAMHVLGRHAGTDQAADVVAELRRILMLVARDGVLHRSGHQLILGVGNDRHGAVRFAWEFTAVDELACHVTLPL